MVVGVSHGPTAGMFPGLITLHGVDEPAMSVGPVIEIVKLPTDGILESLMSQSIATRDLVAGGLGTGMGTGIGTGIVIGMPFKTIFDVSM